MKRIFVLALALISVEALGSAVLLKSPIICVGAGSKYFATTSVVLAETETGTYTFPFLNKGEVKVVRGPVSTSYVSLAAPRPRLELNNETLKGEFSLGGEYFNKVRCTAFRGSLLARVKVVSKSSGSDHLKALARTACLGEAEEVSRPQVEFVQGFNQEYHHSQLFKCRTGARKSE